MVDIIGFNPLYGFLGINVMGIKEYPYPQVRNKNYYNLKVYIS